MTKAPCKDCSDRHAGCHGTCEKYLSWSKIHGEELGKIRAAKAGYAAYNDYERKVSERIKKRRGK